MSIESSLSLFAMVAIAVPMLGSLLIVMLPRPYAKWICAFAGGIGTPYAQTAQAQIAEIIRDSGIEDPTLVQYRSMDRGFYYASGAEPAARRYTGTNLQRDAYLTEIQQLIDGGVPDFVLTQPLDPEDAPAFERYACVAVVPTEYGSGGLINYYCLYQRIEEV